MFLWARWESAAPKQQTRIRQSCLSDSLGTQIMSMSTEVLKRGWDLAKDPISVVCTMYDMYKAHGRNKETRAQLNIMREAELSRRVRLMRFSVVNHDNKMTKLYHRI